MSVSSWLSGIVKRSVSEVVKDKSTTEYLAVLESLIRDLRNRIEVQDKRIYQLEDTVTRPQNNSNHFPASANHLDVTPITKMRFDTKMQRGRILNALNRAGIKTMEQLCNCTKKRLLSIYWFDYQSWKRCVTASKELGYTMRESEE